MDCVPTHEEQLSINTKPESQSCFLSFPPVSATGDRLSRWMRHEHSGRREVPSLQISQRNLAEPHDTEKQSTGLRSLRDVRGALVHGGWSADVMWKIPHSSIICCCLPNCEELHELYLSCFLYHCQSLFWTWKCYFPIDTCIISFCMHPVIIHKQHM